MFNFYIAKASANFGVTYTREIYERAIEVLPDKEAKDMCLKYAELERKLGEIDRARALYAHASQFCDPRVRFYLILRINFKIVLSTHNLAINIADGTVLLANMA